MSADVLAFPKPADDHFGFRIIGFFGSSRDGKRPAISRSALANDTVNGSTAIDLCATDDGFSCFAFFPPDRLAPETIAELGVQQGPDGTDFVVVRLEVKLRDIWLIAETVAGVAEKWYCDPEVISARKLAFAREQRAWIHPSETQAH